jgi:hypothetical protein
VAEFFKDEGYANRPKDIARYARWAIRGDGPGLFGIPTPIGCIVDKDHDDYIVSILLCLLQMLSQ